MRRASTLVVYPECEITHTIHNRAESSKPEDFSYRISTQVLS